jgi:two-component system chemotaxis response regulator CheY
VLQTLIVEDDFLSRKVLHHMLSPLGTADIAVNGAEAVEVFARALSSGEPYNLVCLDIHMPGGVDGHKVLEEIRSIENSAGLQGLDRARVVMTTSSADRRDILSAFRSECDAYLIKPIDRAKLMDQLEALGLSERFPMV